MVPMFKARVALCSPSRCGLSLDATSADQVFEAAEELFRHSSTVLHNDSRARRAFGWDGIHVARNAEGLPEIHKAQLRTWMNAILPTAVDHHDVPYCPPLDSQGRLSALPWHWEMLALGSPSIRAWADLVEAAAASYWLRSIPDWNTPPRYEVFPTMHSLRPNISALRRFREPLFIPNAGHVFLCGRLSHLELRCLARTCLAYHPTGVRIAKMFSRSEDPISQTALEMRELDRTEDPNVRRTSRPRDDNWWRRVAKVLLFAVPRGLGARRIRELLMDELGDPWLNADDVRVLRDRLVAIHRELKTFLADTTCESIGFHLGLEGDTTFNALFSMPKSVDIEAVAAGVSFDAVIRNVIWGRNSAGPFWDKLEKLALTRTAREKIRRTRHGDPVLLMQWPITCTGCVSRVEYCTQYRSMEYLVLADQVMKLALFELVAAGYNVLAVDGEEFVIEIPSDQAEAASRIEELVDSAAERVLQDLAIRCCVCQSQDRW